MSLITKNTRAEILNTSLGKLSLQNRVEVESLWDYDDLMGRFKKDLSDIGFIDFHTTKKWGYDIAVYGGAKEVVADAIGASIRVYILRSPPLFIYRRLYNMSMEWVDGKRANKEVARVIEKAIVKKAKELRPDEGGPVYEWYVRALVDGLYYE